MNYPDPAFELFGTQHLLSLLICFVVILGFPKYFQGQNESRKFLGGRIVASLMILHMLTQPVYDIFLFDMPWQEEFPLHMCDMSSMAMIIFLLKSNAPKLLFHCAYFWGICGATMALATPDLDFGFPHREYSPFFWGHSLILLAVSYVLMVKGERPYLSDIPKVIVITLGLMIVVYLINLIIGPPANYWYLIEKPVDGTLLDYFPEPPRHLLGTIPLAAFLFYVAYLPLFIKDQVAKRA